MKRLKAYINKDVLKRMRHNNDSIPETLAGKLEYLEKVMDQEGIEFSYDGFNEIRFYKKGADHSYENLLFSVGLKEDNTIDYLNWLGNRIISRYADIFMKIFGL